MNTGVDVLVIVVAILVVVYFLVIQPRQRRARVDASLATLAPLVGGTVSNGRLHGTFRGCPLEAWQFQAGTARGGYAAQPPAVQGDRFTIHLGGVAGDHYWQCETEPVHLNPLTPPKLVLTSGVRSVGGVVGRVVGGAIPAPDPELEERLRAHGLMQQMLHLQEQWQHVHVRFSGSLQAAAARQMAHVRPGLAIPPDARERLAAASRLECQVEWRGGLAPPPERFQDLLEALGAILSINMAANPPL